MSLEEENAKLRKSLDFAKQKLLDVANELKAKLQQLRDLTQASEKLRIEYEALLALRKEAAAFSKLFQEFGQDGTAGLSAVVQSVDLLDNAIYHTRHIEPKLYEFFRGDELDELNKKGVSS